jgi:glycine hydroxymethyltransferase
MISSGLRIGTPALATRGFGRVEFTEVADIIAAAISGDLSEDSAILLRERVRKLAEKFPLYPQLSTQLASEHSTETILSGVAQ